MLPRHNTLPGKDLDNLI